MPSTGPVTQQGKAVSRMNALKTGIYASAESVIRVEKPEDLQQLADEYHDHYATADPAQRALVDALIRNEWLLRRLHRIETQLLNFTVNRNHPHSQPLANAYDVFEETLERLQRRINATYRNFNQALKLLREAQAAAPKPKETQPVAEIDQFVPSAPPATSDLPSPKPPAIAPQPENPTPPAEKRPPTAA